MHGMLSFLRFTGVVLVFACVAIALADEPKSRITEALNGTWQADVSDTQTIILRIKDSHIEMSARTGDTQLPAWTGTMRLSEHEPNNQMDCVELRSGATRLPDNKCLFRLRDDVLLIIGGGPDKRPTKFLSGSGCDPKTLVFIRSSPK